MSSTSKKEEASASETAAYSKLWKVSNAAPPGASNSKGFTGDVVATARRFDGIVHSKRAAKTKVYGKLCSIALFFFTAQLLVSSSTSGPGKFGVVAAAHDRRFPYTIVMADRPRDELPGRLIYVEVGKQTKLACSRRSAANYTPEINWEFQFVNGDGTTKAGKYTYSDQYQQSMNIFKFTPSESIEGTLVRCVSTGGDASEFYTLHVYDEHPTTTTKRPRPTTTATEDPSTNTEQPPILLYVVILLGILVGILVVALGVVLCIFLRPQSSICERLQQFFHRRDQKPPHFNDLDMPY